MKSDQQHQAFATACVVIPASTGIHATNHIRLLGALGPRLRGDDVC